MQTVQRLLLFLVFCLPCSYASAAEPQNSVGIRAFDYVEFYVGSARAVAYWHARGLGFDIVGYSGPETGVDDRVSYYLERGDLKLVISSPVRPTAHELSTFIATHGDGVKRIAYEVADVEAAFEHITKRRAIPLRKPQKLEDQDGYVTEAAVKLYDDTEIVLVNYDNYKGVFRPGYKRADFDMCLTCTATGLKSIDHIVGNVRENEMDFWTEYFNRAFNFETFVDFGPGDIATEYSALLSKVVRSGDNVIKHPINEPYFGLYKSQIEEFIEEYQGTGVQHIAIDTEDIISSVDAMRQNGVEFIDVPDTYYDALRNHKSRIKEDIDELQRLKILVDLEGEGYLLQIFTKPVGDRPTFFYEIIQRVDGAEGFGKGNFQALFEAIERDQRERGHV